MKRSITWVIQYLLGNQWYTKNLHPQTSRALVSDKAALYCSEALLHYVVELTIVVLVPDFSQYFKQTSWLISYDLLFPERWLQLNHCWTILEMSLNVLSARRRGDYICYPVLTGFALYALVRHLLTLGLRELSDNKNKVMCMYSINALWESQMCDSLSWVGQQAWQPDIVMRFKCTRNHALF